MARMHSRKKGKSGSSRPKSAVPSWVSYTSEEVEKLVVKYSKEGKSMSEIGMILRDKYGVPNAKAITNKSLGKIVSENGLSKEIPEDLLNLIRKLVMIQSHLEKNKKDQTAKRGFILTDSKIRRLSDYYKKTKVLSADWKLNRDRLKMYLE